MTAPAGLGVGERWRSMSGGARAAVVAISALLLVRGALALLESVTGGSPGGPPSSSYGTAPEGLAAYADLLAGNGHPVHRLRQDLEKARLRPEATVVVADTRLRPPEVTALRRFVEGGGRLVALGQAVAPGLGPILGQGPVWTAAPLPSARPLVPVPEVQGVGAVRTARQGAWRDTGAALPVLAGDQGALVAVATLGHGRVVLVADASPLQNRLLARADNAAFGVAAAGERGRPVYFAEAGHGYGTRGGLGALPLRWKVILAGLFLATLAWMWSKGRRFGPPEEVRRPLPPPRRAYVEALAAALARTRQPAAAGEPLRAAALRQLARRAPLPPDAGGEQVRELATRLGLPPDEAAALARRPGNEDDLLAVGRALARLGGPKP